MELDDEIAVRLEMPAHSLGRGAWRLPGRPSEKHPVGEPRLAASSALVSRSRLVVVPPPRQPRAIDLDVGVMHDFRVSRPEFHRTDVGRRVSRESESRSCERRHSVAPAACTLRASRRSRRASRVATRRKIPEPGADLRRRLASSPAPPIPESQRFRHRSTGAGPGSGHGPGRVSTAASRGRE